MFLASDGRLEARDTANIPKCTGPPPPHPPAEHYLAPDVNSAEAQNFWSKISLSTQGGVSHTWAALTSLAPHPSDSAVAPPTPGMPPQTPEQRSLGVSSSGSCTSHLLTL